MHSRSAAIIAAVRASVGTRFRVQGRRIDDGLDCVGVALIAAKAAGCVATVPPYALGGDHEASVEAAVAAIGCSPVTATSPGDLLVITPGVGRRHLAVVTDRGIVHAHAGLRRVVEGPFDPAWTLVAGWRFPEKG